MTKKYCTHCKRSEVPLVKNTKKRDKQYYICNDCNAERNRKYRKTKKGKDVYRRIMRKQYVQHHEKALARARVRYYLKKGIIKKPTLCIKCKKNKKLEAHHDDYSKPLDVKWVCRDCHNLLK